MPTGPNRMLSSVFRPGRNFGQRNIPATQAAKAKKPTQMTLETMMDAPNGETGGVAVVNGKVHLAGWSWDGTNTNSVVVRFKTNGAVDAVIASHALSQFQRFYAITTHGNDIFTAGIALINNKWQFLVAKYDSAGTPDPSFGTGGFAVSNFTSNTNNAYNVAVQSDGKVIVGGWIGDELPDGSYQGGYRLVRFSSTGTPDPTFGGSGEASIPTFEFGIDDITVDGSDRILAVGECGFALDANGNWITCQTVLARFLANGILDTGSGFGTGGSGFVVGALGLPSPGFQGVRVDSLGKIIVCGTDDMFNGGNLLLARFTSNGVLDNTGASPFGENGSGRTLVGFVEGRYTSGYGLAIMSNDKIGVAGTIGPNVIGPIGVVRFTSGGLVDGAPVTTVIASGNGRCAGIAPDGLKSVMGGSSNVYTSAPEFVAARYA